MQTGDVVAAIVKRIKGEDKPLIICLCTSKEKAEDLINTLYPDSGYTVTEFAVV